MLKKISAFLVACYVSSTSLAAADATTVHPQGGEILIDNGTGFAVISTATKLVPGDRFMVRPGGTALITYAKNCSVRVGSGRVWMVQENPPCAAGDTSIDLTGRMNQSGLGHNSAYVLNSPGSAAGGLATGSVPTATSVWNNENAGRSWPADRPASP